MAIFHCVHRHVGRTTHAAGTAGAHARYVLRPEAVRQVVGEHMPLGRDTARAWLDDQEQRDRKNARVIDKVTLALPRELDQVERVQLVRDFAAEVGGGRIPWLAGIHDDNEDRENPHAHVIFRDRDFETGKRVAELSGKGSTDELRETWERVANQALERAGVDARIDRRTLEAQGIDREPGIHVGPNVLAMEAKGLRPESVPQETETGRVVNWPEIDQGRTRPDRLREIQAANDLGRDVDDDRGKDQGAPPIGAAPATLPAVDEARARWAQRLRELAAEDEAARARQAAQEAPAAPPEGNRTPDKPEAPLQASQGRQEAVPPPEAPTPPADKPEATRQTPQERQEALAFERGRLSAAIERGWQKLASLGQRLEAAWERITHRQAQAQPEAEPLRLDRAVPVQEIEIEEAEPGPQIAPAPPPPPPPSPPPSSGAEQQSAPRPAEPAIAPPSLDNHPLLRRRWRLRGPSMPRL